MNEPVEVVAAERARVAFEGWGAKVLELQTPGGHWGRRIAGTRLFAERRRPARRSCRPGRLRPCGDWLLTGRLLRAGSRRRRTRTHPFRRHLLWDRWRRDYSRSRATYPGQFAEMDQFEPQSNVDNLEAALRHGGRPVTFYRYVGTGHWFLEPDRAQAFNQAAASLAWERTLAFLRRSSTL